MNEVYGGITNLANATFTVTGTGHTAFVGGFSYPVIINASALTRDLLAFGSASGDTLKGGSGVNELNGGLALILSTFRQAPLGSIVSTCRI